MWSWAGRWCWLINEGFLRIRPDHSSLHQVSSDFSGWFGLETMETRDTKLSQTPPVLVLLLPCAGLFLWNVFRSSWEANLLRCDMAPCCWWQGMNWVYAFATEQMALQLWLFVHVYASAFQWFSSFPNQSAKCNIYSQPHMLIARLGPDHVEWRLPAFPARSKRHRE